MSLQIENITALIEQPSEEMEKVRDTLRMDVINNTINLDKRIFKLYDLIENELLGPLVCSSKLHLLLQGMRPRRMQSGASALCIRHKSKSLFAFGLRALLHRITSHDLREKL